jgi:tRNA(Arg) A34 adenosine deaminase TadA
VRLHSATFAALYDRSCQPCGMCTGAIGRSGIGRVVYALSADA